ncbi:hypothetical protein [Dawidia soli]|uniref:Uncharacterized protein n=1 Tax=Dawidia soli TaxID=2782352 RepID=A0AAP2DBV0_9BACT|nr:hypothetical protein [Dawidia soli]MBT1689163.1 hypothetical protein [Dawidia soli]
MARQDSIIKFKGQMGGISFYKSAQDGHLARQKGGVDAKRIQTDPAFARTRENGSEFGRAGSNGKLLRTAFRSQLLNTGDSRMANRLSALLNAVLKTDQVSLRGQRNVANGDLNLLRGFDFNDEGKLTHTFFAPYAADVDRVTGTVTIDVPAFVPTDMIAYPDGATHFRLVAAAAEVDFAENAYNVQALETDELVLGALPAAPVNLALTMSPGNTDPLFVVLGIEFAQLVNGQMYTLNNGAYNALSLVAIEPGA